MSGSPRRHRLRCEEDISGQFRVTVPDAGELEQLRTQGECTGGDCILWGVKIMCLLRGLSLYLLPPENLPQSQWIQMMPDELLKRYIGESGNRLVGTDLVQWEM